MCLWIRATSDSQRSVGNDDLSAGEVNAGGGPADEAMEDEEDDDDEMEELLPRMEPVERY